MFSYDLFLLTYCHWDDVVVVAVAIEHVSIWLFEQEGDDRRWMVGQRKI